MTNTLLAYKQLDCTNTTIISSKIYNFLKEETNLLTSGVIGWQFIDSKQLLKFVPELMTFFIEHKLAVRNAAVTILYETGQLPLHIDELPVIAKINFPVSNTEGWVNRWYSISQDKLDLAHTIINQFDKSVPDLSTLSLEYFTLISELHNMNTPIVFNSRIPHDVVKTTATTVPRIVASFTFHNEPIELLK